MGGNVGVNKYIFGVIGKKSSPTPALDGEIAAFIFPILNQK
jgi:hypothetical protein